MSLEPRIREKILLSRTHKVVTGCGNAYVTVTHDEHGLTEAFMTLGRSGGCAAAQTEALCRLISVALRAGVDYTVIVKHLKNIKCPSPILYPEEDSVLSCADGLAKVLEKEALELEKNQEKHDEIIHQGDKE